MAVQIATGIKGCETFWTRRFTIQVFRYSQLMPASTAKNRFLFKFFFGPNARRATAAILMAFIAGEIGVTTVKLDGNPINFGMIMFAACFFIKNSAFYEVSFNFQCNSSYGMKT